MKQVGKIIVFLFLIFVLTGISLLVQEILGLRITRLSLVGVLFTCFGSYFFTYSKWANNNIWNRSQASSGKVKDELKSIEVPDEIEPKKEIKQVTKNNSKKDDNTLTIALVFIGIILLVYLLSNNNNNDYYFEESTVRTITTPEVIERVPNQAITPKKPKPKPKPKSAWFNPDNNDPFAEVYAYSNGVIKSYENVEVLKPKIKIYEKEPYGAMNYERWEVFLTGLNFKLNDKSSEYDTYDYSFIKEQNGLYAKSKSDIEIGKRYLESKGKPYCSDCSCNKRIIFSIAFQPSNKRFSVSHEISSNPTEFNEDYEFPIGLLRADFGDNPELINAIRSNNKMFIKPSIEKTCRKHIRLGPEILNSTNRYRSMRFYLYTKKENYPGLFSGKPYFEFSLSGSTRAISNAKIHQGTSVYTYY